MVRIAQFNHSETPPPSTWGVPGDQLKVPGEYEDAVTFERGELNIVPWYDGKWGFVLRPVYIGDALYTAHQTETACRNINVGYSQTNDRLSFYRELKKAGTAYNIKNKCNADCSSGWAAIANLAGINVDVNAWTGTMRTEALKSGKYLIINDSRLLNSDRYLLEGDVLLREPNTSAGGHTGTVIDDGDDEGTEIMARVNYGLWNLRRSPTERGPITEILKGGTRLSILLPRFGDWYLVLALGMLGFLHRSGIVAEMAEVIADTWLRREPVIDGENKIWVLRAGSDVIYLGERKKDSRGVEWYMVSDGSTCGWISSKNSILKGEVYGI